MKKTTLLFFVLLCKVYSQEIEYQKPDLDLISKIRTDFNEIYKNIEVSYEIDENSFPTGNYLNLNPKILIKLSDESNIILEGRKYYETKRKMEVAFALWPYLYTEKDKEAYVVLMSYTNEYYIFRDLPKDGSLPFSKNFDEKLWEENKNELIVELKKGLKKMFSNSGKYTGKPYNIDELGKY